MSKGLEALQSLYAKLSCKSDIKDIEENLKQYDIIEKELKALEIISKAYGDYATHRISEYELIMIVGENATY